MTIDVPTIISTTNYDLRRQLQVDQQRTRVLVCIIAALLLVIWFALRRQYY